MAELIKCPQCKTDLTNTNRLIIENCGHSKCRQCLISEVDGCQECKQSQNLPIVSPSTKEKINIIENKRLPYILPNACNLEKTRSVRSSFPSHIVKEYCDDKVGYLCTICEKRFSSRTQQYYHLFCDNTSNKPYKCEQCQKTFATSSHLKYHMEGHSPNTFSCSVCGKTFAKLQVLRKHEKIHTAVSLQCTECGIKLKNKVAFAAHLQRHRNIFPYSCDVCDKKFSLKSTLKTHKIIHSGHKRFKCDQCNKNFDRKSTLQLHILRHSKLKKFSCSECCKRFIDLKSLMRHSKIHIGKSKFKCTLCETTSIRKDNITRHIRNMHPNASKSCIEIVVEATGKTEIRNNSEESLPQQTPSLEASEFTEYPIDRNVPQIVANSSVIRCIGNVQPVIIPRENKPETQICMNAAPAASHPAATPHKKLKKKYDPHEIYRKILLDDDSTMENDTNSMSESTNPATDQSKPESTSLYSGQQSNFSETHWRKNFKYTYQTQFD